MLKSIKEIYASKIDYQHIRVPCETPKICKRDEHCYGSCGELHNRIESRKSHCSSGENIRIIIDKKTLRPFDILYKKGVKNLFDIIREEGRD